MRAKTVLISGETAEALRSLAREHGISEGAMVKELVSSAKERRLLKAMNAAYAEMASDPGDWAAYRAELRVWDPTLSDGLD